MYDASVFCTSTQNVLWGERTSKKEAISIPTQFFFCSIEVSNLRRGWTGSWMFFCVKQINNNAGRKTLPFFDTLMTD